MKINILRIKNHLEFNRVNIWKTLLINFTYLPFFDACKFPIIVRGKCKIANLGRGKIEISDPIYMGMIGIGNSDPFRSYYSKSFINISGNLVLSKGVVFRRGINLEIAKDAVVRLDPYVYIGDNCTIVSHCEICIHSSTRVGNNVLIMDTDFHFVVNTKTHRIKRNQAAVYIGENNWIGSWCIIKKGAITVKGTIIAGPYSMVGKDYSQIPEFSMIAGSPAKLVAEGVRRVVNINTENMLKEYFALNKDVGSYILSESDDIENFYTLE